MLLHVSAHHSFKVKALTARSITDPQVFTYSVCNVYAKGDRTVQEMKAGIDVHALEQDVEAALRLQDLTQQLYHQEASLSR